MENHDLTDYSVAVSRNGEERWRLDTAPRDWFGETLTPDDNDRPISSDVY